MAGRRYTAISIIARSPRVAPHLTAAPHTDRLLADEAIVGTNRYVEYITFRIARRDFAMRTEHVRGILPAHDVIAFEADEFPNRGNILGVTSLKGRDLPVIDLRTKFGIERGTQGRSPCIIVIEVPDENCSRWIGFIADRVSEIVRLRDRDMSGEFVRVNGRSRRVLEPASILAGEEIAACLSL